MSYSEYTDMFIRAQKKKSNYLMCIFDIKNSKQGYNPENMEMLIINLMFDVMKKHPKALVKNTSHPMFQGTFRFRLGDLFGFVVDPRYISEEEILEIFRNNKIKMRIREQFHYNFGYFETYDWVQGNKLYYFGYCIQELDERSKLKKELI